MKQKAVFVTAQVEVTSRRTHIGICLREAILTPAQCDLVCSHLRKVMESFGHKIRARYYKDSTIFWAELGMTLGLRSLERQMRRFGQILKRIGLAKKVEVCSPFPVSYR